MKLTEFYKQLFLEAVNMYEPVWEEEDSVMFGYRWHKRNYPLIEPSEYIRGIHKREEQLTFILRTDKLLEANGYLVIN